MVGSWKPPTSAWCHCVELGYSHASLGQKAALEIKTDWGMRNEQLLELYLGVHNLARLWMHPSNDLTRMHIINDTSIELLTFTLSNALKIQ